jgi:hypothetical protein
MANQAKVSELYVELTASTAKFKSAMGEASNEAGRFSQRMRAETTEARHGIHLLSEDIGLKIPRALQGVIAGLPGVSKAINAAFSSIAVIAFAEVAIESFKKVEEHFKKQKEAAEKAIESFKTLAENTSDANKEIEKSNRSLESTIAQLTKKQDRNGLRNALLDAADAAETLSKKLQIDIDKVLKLNGEQKQSMMDKLMGTNGKDPLHSSIGNALWNAKQINSEYDAVGNSAAASGNAKNYNQIQKDRAARLQSSLGPDAAKIKEYLREHQNELGKGNTDFEVASNAYNTIQGIISASASQTKNGNLHEDEVKAKDANRASASSKAASTAANKKQEEELTKIESHFKDMQAQYNLGAGWATQYWETVLDKHKWGLAETTKINGQISEGVSQFNVKISEELKSYRKYWNEVKTEPQQGFKALTQGADQLVAAMAQGDELEAKHSAAISEAALSWANATGRISDYTFAIESAKLKDSEYVQQRAALQTQLNELQKNNAWDGIISNPESQAKQKELKNKIGDLDASHNIQNWQSNISAANATLKGQIDDVLDEMRRKSQETYKSIAQDMVQFTNGINSATASAMIGHGKRQDFAQVFSGTAHSLAQQSLEKIESGLLGKGKKRDGQADNSALIVQLAGGPAAKIAASGVTGSGVTGSGTDAPSGTTGAGADIASSIVGGGSAKSTSPSMGGDVTKASKSLLSPLMNSLNDNNFLGSHFGSLFGSNSLFGGFRASGGTVTAGASYVVGEHEPELFTPDSAGRILNMNQVASMMGTEKSSSSATYNIDARGTDASMVHQAVYQGMTMAHSQAVSDSQKQMHDSARRTPR